MIRIGQEVHVPQRASSNNKMGSLTSSSSSSSLSGMNDGRLGLYTGRSMRDVGPYSTGSNYSRDFRGRIRYEVLSLGEVSRRRSRREEGRPAPGIHTGLGIGPSCARARPRSRPPGVGDNYGKTLLLPIDIGEGAPPWETSPANRTLHRGPASIAPLP